MTHNTSTNMCERQQLVSGSQASAQPSFLPEAKAWPWFKTNGTILGQVHYPEPILVGIRMFTGGTGL